MSIRLMLSFVFLGWLFLSCVSNPEQKESLLDGLIDKNKTIAVILEYTEVSSKKENGIISILGGKLLSGISGNKSKDKPNENDEVTKQLAIHNHAIDIINGELLDRGLFPIQLDKIKTILNEQKSQNSDFFGDPVEIGKMAKSDFVLICSLNINYLSRTKQTLIFSGSITSIENGLILFSDSVDYNDNKKFTPEKINVVINRWFDRLK